jgi:hypothetical protein
MSAYLGNTGRKVAIHKFRSDEVNYVAEVLLHSDSGHDADSYETVSPPLGGGGVIAIADLERAGYRAEAVA